MTRTTFYTATTLDGFIADEHDSLDWLFVQDQDEKGPLNYDEFIKDIGVIVMGATTYEWIVAHLAKSGEAWPYKIPAWVVSHRELAGVEGADIRFAQGDVAPLHDELVAAADGKDVWVCGGGDLAAQFAEAGKLDQVICYIAPVTLGAGRPLFPRRFDFRLVEVHQNKAFIAARYDVVGPRLQPRAREYVAFMTLPAPAPDRAALVTGASQGIGAEIARELARRGHRLVLVARSEDKLRALADEIAADGGQADVLAVDLADRSARAVLPSRVIKLGVTIDVLVNNAGFSTVGRVSEADPDTEMQMVEVDVVAVVDLCTRFIHGMVERGRGAILNVASTAAFQPLPGQAGYAAGKAFVLSYTQSLVGELKGSGVTATALCPGPVNTGFGERAGFTKEEAEKALPSVMWVDATAVAKAAVEGLDKGRMVVIPGVANRVAAAMAQVTPRTLLLPVLRTHPGLK